MQKSESENINETKYRAIIKAIRLAKKTIPVHIKCLVYSVALKKMLDRRNISNTLFLGLQKDEKDKLKAHAWVCASNKEANTEYKQIAYFS